MRIPVELRGAVTEVAAAAGRPAPDFVFANARDYGYFLLLLDSASVRALEGGALDAVDDAFLRAMLWGALWDQVRDYRMDPERFVRLALRELPRETDEQIVPVVLARLDRAVAAYLLPGSSRAACRRKWSGCSGTGAADTARAYGIRKAYVDAFIGLAASAGRRREARLAALGGFGGRRAAPRPDPLGHRDPPARARRADGRGTLRRAERRDTTADGRRLAFIAGAGRPSAETKRDVLHPILRRLGPQRGMGRGQPGPVQRPRAPGAHASLSAPALDSLPFIQANRRIFFLETWLAAFLRGQTGDSALGVVRQYLAEHPRLPLDLRRKVLQHMDELERTVRIRERAR